MTRIRGIVLAAALSALALAALGAPTAAATAARLAIVQGMPGKVVDVCLGGQEIKSGLAYGGKVFKSKAPGTYTLKIYPKHSGTCTGTRLSQRTLTLASGADLTIVATAFAPQKIVVFDNVGLGTLVPATAGTLMVVRNASDLGPVTVRYLYNQTPIAWFPTVDPVLDKGVQGVGSTGADTYWVVWVTYPEDNEAIVDPIHHIFGDSRRAEYLVIGTSQSNVRFIQIDRPIL